MEIVTKTCSKCNKCKIIGEFNKNSKSKDGYRYECKECQKINYVENREYYINKMKENREEKIDEYTERDRKNYIKNRDSILIKKKQYHINNQEIILEKAKEYYYENKDKRKIYNNNWVKENIEYCRKYQKEYAKEYRKKYPHIILWRSVLNCTLIRLNKAKEGHTIDLLGYSALELKEHIESLFLEGMGWSNRNEWHIDHIKPVSSFDPETPMNIVNALSNLQPLWATDNIKKGNKLIS